MQQKSQNSNEITPRHPTSKRSTISTNFGLKCLYSNVDQLLNKMDDLRMLIASNEPDLMVFTEGFTDGFSEGSKTSNP